MQSLEGANVQATLTGSADVNGQVEVDVKVEAGSTLIAIEQSVKSLIAYVKGSLSPNGPGSTGRSSPDAEAPPPRVNTGGATGAECWVSRRTEVLEARPTVLEARATVSEVLFSAIAGLAFRAAPADVRDQGQ